MIEINQTIPMECCETADFSMDYLKAFFREKCLENICENLKNGYKEMSRINLYLAELGFEQDIIDLCIYESKLTGSEKL